MKNKKPNYGDTLESYVKVLADKFYDGEITRSKFERLAVKLAEWELEALKKGIDTRER